jgi:DNA polymerase-3 subunit epsilon
MLSRDKEIDMAIFRGKDKRDYIDWPAKMSKRLEATQDQRLVKFYQQGVIHPDTPLMDATFVALDFETTGLSPQGDDIVSIGLVPFTLKRICYDEALHWIINPRKPLTDESIVVHGITHSDVIGAPDLDNIIESLLSALAGSITVVHFRHIEREFLNSAFKARLGEGIVFPIVDTFELESRIHRTGISFLWSELVGRNATSIRLPDCRTRYNLPHYKQHNALSDAVATAELLQAQIHYHYSLDTKVSEIWV